MLFNGSVKITGGEFRTLQELITAAINARTYSADGPTNTTLKADAVSRIKAAQSMELRLSTKTGAGDVYMMDAFKGVRNGVTTQASLAAGDFTAEPGGGEVLKATVVKQLQVGRQELSNRLIYAAADAIIYIDAVIA